MSNRVVLVALCMLAIGLGSRPCAAKDDYSKTIAVARKEAAEAQKTWGVFSVTTAVMVDGEVVYAEAFGGIGKDGKTPPDTATQFNVGSIAKVFTAVAILRLRDLGRLDLDKPVVHYLPQFRMNDRRYRQITIRTLLDHTAGIPGTNYYNLFGSEQNPFYIPETLATLRDSPMKSAPGDMNVYCNDCFTVASAVIERLSGRTFTEFMRREVFMKAGMTDTSYSFKKGNANIAATYSAQAPHAMLPPEIVNARATGGLTTTAVDLCLFARALMDGDILSRRSLRDLQKAQPGRVGAGFSLADAGLGWDSVAEPDFAAKGLTVLAKDGITAFFRSQMYVAPKQNVTVATVQAGPPGIPPSVATSMSKQVMFAALVDHGDIKDGPVPPPPLPPEVPIPESLLHFAGIYGGVGHAIVNLTFDLKANVLNSARLIDGKFKPGDPFKYRGDGIFSAPDNRLYSFALARGGGKVLRQYVDDEGNYATIAESVEPEEGNDTSEFEATTWVPQNLGSSDFVTLMYNGIFKTDALAAVPGIVYLHAGNPGDATPYGLINRYTTRMILRFETDLVELRIRVHKDGKRTMRLGAFEFLDAQFVAPLQPAEQIVIDAAGGNVARKVTTATSFTSSIPAQGRIVIYAPDGTVSFDSLLEVNRTVALSLGSIVLFVGDPDAVFFTQAI